MARTRSSRRASKYTGTSGLLESADELCLAHELSLRRLRFERQRAVPLSYKGVQLECGRRVDFVGKTIRSSPS